MHDFHQVCIDQPTAERTLLLPDSSGMILTSDTTHAISSLVGLRGNRTLQYTGEAHERSPQWKYKTVYNATQLLGAAPPRPRLDCAAVNCSAGPGGSRPRSTFEFGYASSVWLAMDLRVWEETKGKWLGAAPSYFSFVCPRANVNCDILDYINDETSDGSSTMYRQFGIRVRKKPSVCFSLSRAF